MALPPKTFLSHFSGKGCGKGRIIDSGNDPSAWQGDGHAGGCGHNASSWEFPDDGGNFSDFRRRVDTTASSMSYDMGYRSLDDPGDRGASNYASPVFFGSGRGCGRGGGSCGSGWSLDGRGTMPKRLAGMAGGEGAFYGARRGGDANSRGGGEASGGAGGTMAMWSSQVGGQQPRAKGLLKAQHYNKVINRQITRVAETGDLPRLLEEIYMYLPEMNGINLTTAFHRVAKLAAVDGPSPKSQAQIQSHPVFERLLRTITPHILNHSLRGEGEDPCPPRSTYQHPNYAEGWEMPVQCMSIVTWSLATLRLRHKDLFAKIAWIVCPRIDQLKPFELSNLLWAYAKMATVPRQLFMVASERMLRRRPKTFKAQCLSTIAWSYATAEKRDATVFASIAEELMLMTTEMKTQEIANTLWAFAKNRCADADLFHVLSTAAVAEKKIHQFKAQELSNTVWAFATVGIVHADLFAEIEEVAAAKRFQMLPQNIANVLWSYAKLQVKRHTDMFPLFLNEAASNLTQYKRQELSTMIWSAAQVCPTAANFFGMASRHCCYRLVEFSPNALSNLIKDLADVSTTDPQCLTLAIQETLRRYLQLEPAQLCNTWRGAVSALSNDSYRLEWPALLVGTAALSEPLSLVANKLRLSDLQAMTESLVGLKAMNPLRETYEAVETVVTREIELRRQLRSSEDDAEALLREQLADLDENAPTTDDRDTGNLDLEAELGEASPSQNTPTVGNNRSWRHAGREGASRKDQDAERNDKGKGCKGDRGAHRRSDRGADRGEDRGADRDNKGGSTGKGYDQKGQGQGQSQGLDDDAWNYGIGAQNYGQYGGQTWMWSLMPYAHGVQQTNYAPWPGYRSERWDQAGMESSVRIYGRDPQSTWQGDEDHGRDGMELEDGDAQTSVAAACSVVLVQPPAPGGLAPAPVVDPTSSPAAARGGSEELLTIDISCLMVMDCGSLRLITLEELVAQKVVGGGHHVVTLRHGLLDMRVVLKRLERQAGFEEQLIKHPHVLFPIARITSGYGNAETHVAYMHCKYGSLHDYVSVRVAEGEPVRPAEAARIVRSALLGMDAIIGQNPVAVNLFQPGELFIDVNEEPRIRQGSPRAVPWGEDLKWMSPEETTGTILTDVWPALAFRVGLILYCMCTPARKQLDPYPHMGPEEVLMQLIAEHGDGHRPLRPDMHAFEGPAILRSLVGGCLRCGGQQVPTREAVDSVLKAMAALQGDVRQGLSVLH